MDAQDHPLRPYADTFLALAEGRLSVEDWIAWLDEHGRAVKSHVSPRFYLSLNSAGLKRPASGAAVRSQWAVCEVLDQLGVAYTRSDRYDQEWKQAEEQATRESAARTAAKVAGFGPTIDRIGGRFPRFADFLRNNLDEVSECQPGLDDAEIQQLEDDLGLGLPEVYRGFLRCTREIAVGPLNMTTMHPFFHDSTRVALPTQDMLSIGDYFLEADGDQVLFDLRHDAGGDPPVIYYAHGVPAIRTIAASFTEWVENLPNDLTDNDD